MGQSGGRGRDAANVVLYEDAARARLHGFLRALEGVRGVLRAVRAFDGVRSRLKSPALLAIVTEGDADDADTTWATNDAAWGACAGASTPELSERLAFFERAFDWDKARESGRIEPKPGADEAVDADAAADEARPLRSLEPLPNRFLRRPLQHTASGAVPRATTVHATGHRRE